MGTRSRLTTIRFRLGLAVALALSPVLALGALQSWGEFRRDARAQTLSLTQAAQRSAVLARARVQASAALLDTITPQAVGFQCAPRLAGLLDRNAGYVNLIRFNAIGRVVCAAATTPAQEDRRAAAWFERLRGGAPVVVANIPAGVDSKPAVLAAVRAVDARGQFDGALASIIRLESLRPDTADPTLPPGTEVALADAAGHLLVATRAGAFAALPPGWSAAADRPGGMLYTSRAPDGRDRMHAVAPLLDRDIYVVLSAPQPGLLFWAKLNPFASIILPLMAWLLAWAAVAVVTERVVIRWLSYLERVAAIYAKGRFSVRPVQAESEGAPAEIQALAHALHVMADAIVQRDTSLRDSLAHKDALMREIHHRVKNNLQVITSLLNMQQRALTDPAARAAMSDTRQRITALALIYRALYQSPDLRRVDVRQFLEELVAHLTAGEGGRPSNIRTQLTADDLEIDPDKLAPLALFAVEAISNARKHAYDEDGGMIMVRFTVSTEEVVLEIADQGRGDSGALAGAGVGRTLMSAFARQLRGRAEIGAGPDGGVVARLIFPAPEAPPQDGVPAPVETLPPPRGEGGNQAAA
jgi:two-component sensor histidine kinase